MTPDEADAEIAAMEAHPKAAIFENAIADLRRRYGGLHGVVGDLLADDVRILKKAMSKHGVVNDAERFERIRIDNQAVADGIARRAERRARLRAQLDGTISAGDLDYIASRAGERRRTGQTLGQTQHMLNGAKAK